MKITAKITKVKRRGGFDSLRLSIVSYFRDGHGRPNSKIISAFPTVRSINTDNANVQRAFWKRAETEINRLRESNHYMNNDLDSIENKFAEVIPKPTVLASITPAPNLEALYEKFPWLKEAKRA